MTASGNAPDAIVAMAASRAATAAEYWSRIEAPVCGLLLNESVARGSNISAPKLLHGAITHGLLADEIVLRAFINRSNAD